ncbi:MAG: flagellin [Thermodesulfobacteriota bacterium]
MSLTINHNLMAMNAARSLSITYGRLSTSVQRLASGLRINSAADDAAGLAVREMMRTDIRVLNQGVRNANDAISMIQTADGALSVIDEKLTRMKELAEQAATGTYTTAQRLIMDSEFQAMASEINRIANATDFNGVKLLDGSLSGAGLDGATGNQMKIHFGTGNASAEDYYYVKISGATTSALGLGSAGGTAAQAEANFVSSHGLSYDSTLPYSVISGTPASLDAVFNPTDNLNLYEIDPFNDRYFIGTGSDGNMYAIRVDAMMTTYLSHEIIWSPGSGSSVVINTQPQAQQALEKLDSAIAAKDNIRANLGALANRLANTVSNLAIQAENLQAAESRVSDMDVATEMTEFTRNQILAQAAVSMLAQANSLPQLALQLINQG